MAEQTTAFNLAFLLLIVLMLAPIVVAAWRIGLFDRGGGEVEQTEFIVNLPDESVEPPPVADPTPTTSQDHTQASTASPLGNA